MSALPGSALDRLVEAVRHLDSARTTDAARTAAAEVHNAVNAYAASIARMGVGTR